jgi:hypothetical protein
MSTLFHQLHADPWSTSLVDVASLNARASDAVLAAIAAVRGAAFGDAVARQSRSFLIVGPAGAGKTHLFARLRRRAGSRAAFVLLRPELAVDPTPRLVLASAIDALRRPVPGQDLTQLDVAVGSALSIVRSGHARWPLAALDHLRSTAEPERAEQIENVVDLFEKNHPEVDLDWLGRFLELPFAGSADRRAAVQWLSGREPDAHQLARLGLREPLPDASVMPALRTLGVVASLGAPLVIVFDQLENLVEEGGATGRIHAHARLYSELHDVVPGLVLVQMALDSEWQARISPALGAAEKSRLEARVLTLDLPDADQRLALLEAWLSAVDPQKHPPWPFSPAGWAKWQNAAGVTPRRLMIAAREALQGDEAEKLPDIEATPERLEELWEEHLTLARTAIDDAMAAGRPLDAEKLTSGIAAVLGLIGTPVQIGTPRDAHQLRAGEGERATDLFVVQKSHPRSVAAHLERARDAASRRRVVAVREASRPFPPTWKQVISSHDKLVRTRNAIWLELALYEVSRLLALHDLLAAARSQDLAGKDGSPIGEPLVREWALGELGVTGWAVVTALVGAGQADGDAPVPVPVPHWASDEPVTPPPQRPHRSEPRRTDTMLDPNDPVATAVARLRLASVERILHEARAADPALSLAATIERLRALEPRLMWFGRSIVWWEDGS